MPKLEGGDELLHKGVWTEFLTLLQCFEGLEEGGFQDRKTKRTYFDPDYLRLLRDKPRSLAYQSDRCLIVALATQSIIDRLLVIKLTRLLPTVP